MAEFDHNVRQRKLYEQRGDYTSQVTISIETADHGFQIRTSYGISPHSHGLRDPEKPDAPALMYPVKSDRVLPASTFEQAVRQAEIEFRTCVDHEFYTPLPVDEDFPS